MIHSTDSLAIIIPAYKSKFLRITLDSIASQTDKRFCVYIGDDNSPNNIEDIVQMYYGKFNFIYYRFDNNLGGTNLVAHWERCINLTQGEKWIWLFSDDDCMDSTCVENFYREIEYHKESELMRFNVDIVDKDSHIMYESVFPPFVPSNYLFKKKLKGEVQSFAVEYIFTRDVHERMEGFQNFDLAWGSDTATWIKFGENGIRTIPDSRVQWRKSEYNITGKSETIYGLLRKFRASNDFLLWARNYWKSRNANYNFFIDCIFIRRLHEISNYVPKSKCMIAAYTYWGNNRFRKYILISLFLLYHVISNLKVKR